ncbi:MAG: HesA/MoeB/ThiF family protein [Candidatus Omnitrophica bacterium]|nr:HesA/MoeB/ThiF family protein [Candidatus Omnitrophota bacterium]
MNENELKRYNRQMILEGWGAAGQKRLKQSTVFVAGAGGLGSPVLTYLAVAGVGTLRLCDFDTVDYSNLNRQILHNPARVNVPKALSAKQSLEALNEDIVVTALEEKITAENAEELVGGADIIVDCMDNFPTRFALNRVSVKHSIPYVFGAVWGLEGRLSVFHPPLTPCLNCVFPEGPPPEVFPIVGATPGVIGSMQALETLKCLTGVGEPLKNELLVWDGNTVSFSRFKMRKNPKCPTCG